MHDVRAGIDVSAKTLRVATDDSEFDVNNTPEGHQKLIGRLTRSRRRVRVCLESTGFYSLDLAVALFDAQGVEVMVINPRIARRFAQALTKRSKTDPVDARVLREYTRRMEFVPWHPPKTEHLQLRAIARRMAALTQIRTQEKNRLHAAQSCQRLEPICHDIEVNIRHLERRLEQLLKQALRLIERQVTMQVAIARMISVKGIALLSAVQIYGELCVLPQDLTARQWVAHAGLDPRHLKSGTFEGKTRISKTGNRFLRAALYMPAHNAMRFETHVMAFADHLIAKGKTRMQAKVAVMRKLLHAIHGMQKNEANFSGAKFYPALQENA